MKVLILDSAGSSGLGWVTEPATQQILADSLERAGLDVAMAEVATSADLDEVFRGLSADTLVWPNAYHVRAGVGSDDREWLADLLEARGMPFVGSPAAALRAMLHKDDCQARLAAAGIPIARFAAVGSGDPAAILGAFEAAGLSWPVVVKPTSAAGSLGISVAGGVEDLTARVNDVLERFGSQAIIEEYLPSADITVGVLIDGTETALLPTWYQINGRQPAGPSLGRGILDRRDRLQPWGGAKQMRQIREPRILEQIEAAVPRVARTLGIRDVTRIDGRLDARGVLRIFDVNGMPALDYPDAVILRQVMTIWDGMDALAALDRLACTLVASAAERYGLEAPDGVAANAFSGRAADRRAPAVA